MMAFRFPHLSTHDAAVARDFFNLRPWLYESARFDVPVGQGRAGTTTAERLKSHPADVVLLKRIDFVLTLGTTQWVVEIKPKACAEGIGQALCYSILVSQTAPSLTDVRPVLLFGEPDADLELPA